MAQNYVIPVLVRPICSRNGDLVPPGNEDGQVLLPAGREILLDERLRLRSMFNGNGSDDKFLDFLAAHSTLLVHDSDVFRQWDGTYGLSPKESKDNALVRILANDWGVEKEIATRLVGDAAADNYQLLLLALGICFGERKDGFTGSGRHSTVGTNYFLVRFGKIAKDYNANSNATLLRQRKLFQPFEVELKDNTLVIGGKTIYSLEDKIHNGHCSDLRRPLGSDEDIEPLLENTLGIGDGCKFLSRRVARAVKERARRKTTSASVRQQPAVYPIHSLEDALQLVDPEKVSYGRIREIANQTFAETAIMSYNDRTVQQLYNDRTVQQLLLEYMKIDTEHYLEKIVVLSIALGLGARAGYGSDTPGKPLQALVDGQAKDYLTEENILWLAMAAWLCKLDEIGVRQDILQGYRGLERDSYLGILNYAKSEGAVAKKEWADKTLKRATLRNRISQKISYTGSMYPNVQNPGKLPIAITQALVLYPQYHQESIPFLNEVPADQKRYWQPLQIANALVNASSFYRQMQEADPAVGLQRSIDAFEKQRTRYDLKFLDVAKEILK